MEKEQIIIGWGFVSVSGLSLISITDNLFSDDDGDQEMFTLDDTSNEEQMKWTLQYYQSRQEWKYLSYIYIYMLKGYCPKVFARKIESLLIFSI